MSSQYPRVRISVDRGGTFTDIYAEIDTAHNVTERKTLKLLSVDPNHYDDAPTEGIRRILSGICDFNSKRLQTSTIQFLRMGTTIATNALLERQGQPCALVATAGFIDMLSIGNQSRPNIFDLKVKKMPVLQQMTVKARERVLVNKEMSHQHSSASRSLHVSIPLDTRKLEEDLRGVRAKGITSLAVALMHSYAFKDHEHLVRDIAYSLGFENVSLSSELTPMVKVVPRAFTATVDAYLTPKIRGYIERFKAGFENDLAGVDVQFMQSDGGLCDIDDFCGYVSVLSGPAGGVVGYARSLYGFERHAPEVEKSKPPSPVIGFDMGGTSTDVSRYCGHLEHVFETELAGVTIQAPQLDIKTIAAGGGSILSYRNGMFYVGPESAGADPGPVCYRKGGSLTVTDANLMLGRLHPALFPRIFGKSAKEPLDVDATRIAFEKLTEQINLSLRAKREPELTAQEVAEGFINVANEAMSRPIRQLTEAKGFDVRGHALACFGGAGGQHACAIAKSLGIETVFVHKYSGILSAYGIALADSVAEVQEPLDVVLNSTTVDKEVSLLLQALEAKTLILLRSRKFEEAEMRFEKYLNLRYDGTDFGIMIRLSKSDALSLRSADIEEAFTAQYAREYGFSIPDRDIIVDDVRVRALGLSEASVELATREDSPLQVPHIRRDENGDVATVFGEAFPFLIFKSFYSQKGGWLETSAWRSKDLPPGRAVLAGPCMIVDSEGGNTIVVDPECTARVASDGNILISVLQRKQPNSSPTAVASSMLPVDHVKLSIYAHRFMGIAEQMGAVLQRTAISTNIKERLDFSCALFDETGGLVANAPHVPVHLGAMQDAVKFQIRYLGDAWQEGEVILSNHPEAGGTHLPDVTVITPVYHDKRVIFYVASRGHHADIGGMTPGSMPPMSKSLDDEGLAIKSFKLVKDGIFQESELKRRLDSAGCRCIKDVLSDLRAQVSANQKGVMLTSGLIEAEGPVVVQSYMYHIQTAAAHAVREMLMGMGGPLDAEGKKEFAFTDNMDDGTKIDLSLKVDTREGSAIFDFTGSGDETSSNINAPKAVTFSAVIYALRCLVHHGIPLNQGCLDPVEIKLREGSILAPSSGAAVVGGNVLTSQRITDVILGAFGACAASQGCMNNLTFGNEVMGYYETIGGGSGAGPGWHGTSGVHTHMTNTRITDPEILERRYPVIVREFAIRENSGGLGRWRGGDGLRRALEFTAPLTVSILSERRKRKPWGLHGGKYGDFGRNELSRSDGSQRQLGGKSSFEVQAGDIFRIFTPGGGGYGEP